MTSESGTGTNNSTGWKIAVAILAVAVIGLVAWLIIDSQQDQSEDLSQAIAIVQAEMKDLGYYDGAVDGVYGPATQEAVKRVQAECGLTQDGIYGPQTHQCLIDLGGDG